MAALWIESEGLSTHRRSPSISAESGSSSQPHEAAARVTTGPVNRFQQMPLTCAYTDRKPHRPTHEHADVGSVSDRYESSQKDPDIGTDICTDASSISEPNEYHYRCPGTYAYLYAYRYPDACAYSLTNATSHRLVGLLSNRRTARLTPRSMYTPFDSQADGRIDSPMHIRSLLPTDLLT